MSEAACEMIYIERKSHQKALDQMKKERYAPIPINNLCPLTKPCMKMYIIHMATQKGHIFTT